MFLALWAAGLAALLSFAQPAAAEAVSYTDESHQDRRVFSVGDLHGDAQSCQKILKSLGLMGDAGEWTGGRSILVQTGDVTDRGDASGPIFQSLFRLQDEAPASGGKVILLLGNHELMNLQGDFRYATPADTASIAALEPDLKGESSSSLQTRTRIFSKEGWLGQGVRERFQALAVERNVLFVHAGLLPIFKDMLPGGLDSVNAEVKRLLTQDASSLRMEASPLLGDDGPFWTRRLALGPEGSICREVQESLDLVGVTRMVVGHTAQADGRVHSRCQGRLVLGDTLISRFYTGTAHPSAVEYFVDGTAEAIDMLRNQRTALS